MTDFSSLGLSNAVLKAIAEAGFDSPTPIQRDAIPFILQGSDLLGLAQTGTGKTAAFGLPLVERLLADARRPAPRGARALILAPTRELVNQIAKNIVTFLRATPLRVTPIVGGVSINGQIRRLTKGTDILVATPGRLLDLADREAVRLDTASFLVLDEADQMLDLGFIHALRRIAKLIAEKRQTMLFSATMPKQIADLAQSYLTDPVRVEVAPTGKTADRITQCVHFMEHKDKTAFLVNLMSARPQDMSLVFCRTKYGAERLMKKLVASGLKAGSIHGNKSQNQRDRAIRALRSGDISILVATDVAARGIDIPGVSHVYNFELPEVPEAYVHRIGRTARAGADGEAVALCAPEEIGLLRQIEKLIGMPVDVAGGQVPQHGRDAFAARAKRSGKSGRKRSTSRHKDASSGKAAADGALKNKGDNDNASRPRRHRKRRPAGRSKVAA